MTPPSQARPVHVWVLRETSEGGEKKRIDREGIGSGKGVEGKGRIEGMGKE